MAAGAEHMQLEAHSRLVELRRVRETVLVGADPIFQYECGETGRAEMSGDGKRFVRGKAGVAAAPGT